MRNRTPFLRGTVLLGFFLGIGALFYQAFQFELFPIRSIELRSQQVTDQGLAEVVTQRLGNQLDLLRGQSLLKVSVGEVEKELLKQSWIRSYAIKKIWPNAISLGLDFHQGRAVMKRGKEFSVLTDKGLLLPLLAESQKQLPLLVGANFLHSEKLRSEVLGFLAELPARGALASDQLEEIRYEDRSGFVVKIRSSSARFEMGKQSFSLKAARAQQVLDYLQTQQLEARVINTNLSKKVLVRLRRDP